MFKLNIFKKDYSIKNTIYGEEINYLYKKIIDLVDRRIEKRNINNEELQNFILETSTLIFNLLEEKKDKKKANIDWFIRFFEDSIEVIIDWK